MLYHQDKGSDNQAENMWLESHGPNNTRSALWKIALREADLSYVQYLPNRDHHLPLPCPNGKYIIVSIR